MDSLFDFSQPFDVALLERIVQAFNKSTNEAERKQADTILVQFREHPDSWTRVDAILEQAKNVDTKFYALQILEPLIATRWKILPREQCEGIKNFVVGLIIKLSSDEAVMQQNKFFLTKLDLTLVQILKQDWPHNWPTFISDVVGSSKTNETLCENNMIIFRYLSEEIFDFSAEQMTSQKVKDLKQQMCGEFAAIFQLCILVLESAQKPSLLAATLHTLLRFLYWIPLGYIFETSVIQLLINKFFGVPLFRNIVMKCLTEIGSLNVGNVYDEQFRYLFVGSLEKLSTFLPLDFSLAKAYENGTDEENRFIQDLGLFLSGFMREHSRLLEGPQYQQVLLQAHQYLLNVTDVDEREIFKVCLEYWNKLVLELYSVSPFAQAAPLMLNGGSSDRRVLYGPILSKLRLTMINHMAKPEEVLITESDEGEIIRELQKDTDTIALYKSMRECLIYLTHLDNQNMEYIMLDKLGKQMDGSEWSWNNLNKLCWAMGSISGAMSEEDEKRFLVTVIKELLSLTEMKRGKDNKAVVASNIMYIVGQYPRFLKAHWKFLKTVVNKLFEFMHELHVGVQDMACDTFIKISQKCRKHFVVYQVGEVVPFIEEILTMMPSIIADLTPQQINTFYEAVGYMLQAQNDKAVQERLITKFMELPNNAWDKTIQDVARNINVLRDTEVVKTIVNVIKTNISACLAIGHAFSVQLGRIYLDILNLYKAVSEIISSEVLQSGPEVLKHSLPKYLRGIKKETLKLLDTFIKGSEDQKMVAETFVPPMFEVILLDYARNPPQAREADVLNLMATCVEKLEVYMVDKIPAMLDATFECTIQMISHDFQEFPEHRVGFFHFIRCVNLHCFPAISRLPPPQFKLIVDSVVWAFKHTMRDIAETGLHICHELLGNIQVLQTNNPQAAATFYQSFYLSLMQDIFVVLTDREHKTGFKLQAMILQHMFEIVDENKISVPLWTDSQPATMTNKLFLRNHLVSLFGNAFQNLSPSQIQSFVNGLMTLTKDLPAFKSQLRDFLIQLKEFFGQDNQDMYSEEAETALAQQRKNEMELALRVPGMIRPQDRPEFNNMD